jgi:hypothetical protein
MNYPRLDLGAVGLDHVEKYFSGDWSTYPLRNALSTLPLNQGRVWTWARSGMRITAQDLRDGLPEGMDPWDQAECLVRYLKSYLAAGDRLVLLEDHDAGPADPWLEKEKDRVPPERLACADHLYWYATSAPMADKFLFSWGGLFSVMALGTNPLEVKPGGTIDERVIRLFGAAVEHFVVDAFDFEGSLVWSRT